MTLEIDERALRLAAKDRVDHLPLWAVRLISMFIRREDIGQARQTVQFMDRADQRLREARITMEVENEPAIN